MIGMRMVEREAGGQVGGGQKLRRWQKHRLVHNMTALPREFAVLRRWTSGHSRWWISAVRKLRSSHGCGGLVLRDFFFCCGSVKVLLSFLVFFLAVNYHWKKKNRNEAIFRGKIGMKGSLIIYSGIENKDKSKARLSLGLKPDRSREKARYMTKSTKSPLHANRDSGGEDKELEIQSTGQLDFDLRNNEEDE